LDSSCRSESVRVPAVHCNLDDFSRPHTRKRLFTALQNTSRKKVYMACQTASLLMTEHLTVESYTVIICQQSYLLFGIPSPTHFFILGLKPSFSANPSHRCPSFFLLQNSLHRFPRFFTVISEHICFYFFNFFSVFLHFLVVGSVR